MLALVLYELTSAAHLFCTSLDCCSSHAAMLLVALTRGMPRIKQ